MLETLLGNSGGGIGGSASIDAASDGGGEEEKGRGEEGDRNSAGNRWPHEETLALLRIRSEMDLAFRDATLKAPLWDEVSRKLGELGFHRNAKKCKEKFENIYKYHRRTKEGRSGRQNGKNYRFFEQLEVFESQSLLASPSLKQIQSNLIETTVATPTSAMMIEPISECHNFAIPCPIQNPNGEFISTSTSTTSSSGKDSEGRGKKKRKLENYFERLMKEVLEKQENLQNRFLEAIEKCERDRIAREEAWKMQEMARLKKEQEFLAHERALAAAKDAAVLAFLQKISQQSVPVQLPVTPSPVSEENINKPKSIVEANGNNQENGAEKSIDKQDNGSSESSFQGVSSRWPKAEVEALIKLRTNFDFQYQDNGPKGPLWEDISASMKKLGYNRNAKRCKEKWENINKYYRRVKESKKQRTEDSKTCPYFHMLESLYERKSKKVGPTPKPEDILMQMTGQPSQQQQQEQRQHHHSSIEDGEGSENIDQNQEEDDDDDDENGYQIVANNPSSVSAG